jgi:hypothetical protein
MIETPAADAARRRGRVQFLALAALFLGPVGLAFWMYYGGHLVPGHKVNHGELVLPVRTLPAVDDLPTTAGAPVGSSFLRHQWSLVYVAGSACDAVCRQDLAELKLVRLAMEHERDRVHRVLLGRAPCCAAEEIGPADPDLTVAYVDSPAGQRLLAALPPPAGEETAVHSVYIVDPLGNLVMRFAPGGDRKGLIKDLDKLLRLSHIG